MPSAEVAFAAADSLPMWATFAFILGALVLYAVERVPVEVTSAVILCVLLVFFQLVPVPGPDDPNLLDTARLLDGFSNPALLTVLALLVVGQGMVRTGVLARGARLVMRAGLGRTWLTFGICLVTVTVVSAVLNNIPVVVIFIPIVQALAERLGHSASRVMMGLSFVAVLGGSMTLIGSGSNLLVSGALLQAGEDAFGFFEFTVPGAVLAAVGLVYAMTVLPRLLPERSSLAERIAQRSGKYFLAQISVAPDSRLVGAELTGAFSRALPDMRVRMVLRGERVLMPPFHAFKLQESDLVVVAGSRRAFSEVAGHEPGLLHPQPGEVGGAQAEELWKGGERVLAEVMVTPGSRLIGHRLTMAGFQYRTRCAVLGIQRRAQMFRSRLTDVPLEAGDVLLVEGRSDDVDALRGEQDVLLMEWSAEELPVLRHAKHAGLIFAGIVALAATGALPIVVAAILGASAMVATGVLNIRQAVRAVDTKIITMIPATLALGAALQATGGAAFLAHSLLVALQGAGPAVALSGLFLMAAIIANVVGSNACAVLFTPIGVGMAQELGIPPHIFAVAIVFAANAGIATPIGYQTNLLVMGPGHYRFADFVRAGVPLVVLLWLVFSLFAPWYYGI